MIASILESVKKTLLIPTDYDVFDEQIITHINSVFSTLHQLGVGPDQGFMIEDADATWDAFLGDDPRLSHIKSYTFLRVKMLFDPPTTSFVVEAQRRQIEELEWRINLQREDTQWSNPNVDEIRRGVLDGGSPW